MEVIFINKFKDKHLVQIYLSYFVLILVIILRTFTVVRNYFKKDVQIKC